MVLTVYNTLKRNKEEFKPLEKGKVGMYACGITAYDSCHLGHARSAVAFDIVHRWLKYRKYEVGYVQNYTDIDDKIINRANKEKCDWKELTETYIAEYEEVMEKLNVLSPTYRPKATEYINEMIDLIKALEENGLAYKTDGGVYFAVRKFKGYGKLSGKSIDDLESGARISVDESKNDPLDFALWKFKKEGEPFWPSPWGDGRPGWHIECSVMSTKYLGQPFDIHGGGRDLIFPHHENELAQAEGARKKEFVKYWLHNGFIDINSEKMSKSLNNFVTLNELLNEVHPEAIRYFLISAHYRSPIDYTDNAIKESESSLLRFYLSAQKIYKFVPSKTLDNVPEGSDKIEKELKGKLLSFKESFENAMDDDFNTAKALGIVFDLVRSLNKFLDKPKCDCGSPFGGWALLKFSNIQSILGETLGVFGTEPEKFLKELGEYKTKSSGVDTKKIEELIQKRADARKNKNFAEADQVRDELDKMGVEIKDAPNGKTEWRIK